MTLAEYQIWRRSRPIYPGEGSFQGIVYCGLALANEAGEAAGEVKKAWRDDFGGLTPERHEKLVHELGDTFWYLCAMMDEIGVSLETVMIENVAKINKREKIGG
jgi:NTP pyrophosphatase (non-canonical NTP hydrolase)